MAEYLAASGPVWGDAAAASLGLTPDQWWAAVGTCPWFDTIRDGWVLAARGRREVLGEGGGHAGG